ncbi:PLP-dependent aminotransferase family protein [Geothrix sp. PMB-07]|uniref:MocR-like pyridoxine biosynthesis transcription factor PdxR n=1 Tax=Geothrix sp. PMB-07 TaxID=3068640 RepID=UPI00274232C8|nr:PLP-dependent aminotransferase family protein [Geothrix sp. PMB-07]WLT31725.1 PLP-dependent aminotransferase family protein [Geothrix sp. PMB-07]
MREAIRSGQLAKGQRLPATRVLSVDLGLSRVTVEAAYAQLEAEGYLRRKVGSGTFVAIEAPITSRSRAMTTRPASAIPPLSVRGEALVRGGGCTDPLQPLAFAAGSPDLRAFPMEVWQKLSQKRLRQDGEALFRYGDPQGYEPLRQALAGYLRQSRGVQCSPEQVLILSSSQQALQLISMLLLDDGDPVWMEEPGYRGAQTVFRAMGAKLIPVPVDEEGLDSDQAPKGPPPKLIYLTPSRQYPTGVPLSLTRRLALLAYAHQHRAWVVEDDYDSEFQYDHRPLPAMQGLDSHERVLYIGTFSKVLFPSLRLAYMVLPRGLAGKFTAARSVYDGHCAQLPQAIAADFITQGHFAAHIRLMRQLYRSRRDQLREALAHRLSHLLTPLNASGGLQLTVHLPLGQESRLTREALRLGVVTPTLSDLYLGDSKKDGWVLGFSALRQEDMTEGIHRLAKASLKKA